MNIAIRPATDMDANACGRICFAGFRAVNERHGYPLSFPSVEVATERMANFIRHPSVFGVVAECDARIVGFNFLSERDPIRSVGPIVVDPAVQARGVGRKLMEAVLERARSARGVRLLQDTFNVQSLSLYAGLGFEARDIFVVLSGKSQAAPSPDWDIRPMTEPDVTGCDSLHERVHGYTRTNELRDALATGAPIVALMNGRVRAYMTAPTTWLANHGVAETENDMQALLLAAPRIAKQPVSFQMPVRRASLFRWCLNQGYRAIKPQTLMTIGEYREPQGSYFPSVSY
ncbi:MAG TPA: GNAT family N-acetyltransferase [Bradyrhizobium sp.]|nr:GNAT family N-acetyltransferase [Bradyrhizobium sp.]